MWSRRLKETMALTTIGDGALALVAPREHSLLWEVGPEGIRRMTRFFADNPNYMRLLGTSQIAFGLWLVFRQYR